MEFLVCIECRSYRQHPQDNKIMNFRNRLKINRKAQWPEEQMKTKKEKEFEPFQICDRYGGVIQS